jgi:hypothetical protein
VAVGDLPALLGGGATLALVGLAEGLSAARLFASRGGYRIDADQELLAGSGLFGGIGVAGSLSKTAAVCDARCRTQMAGITAAVLSLVVILAIAPALSGCPSPSSAPSWSTRSASSWTSRRSAATPECAGTTSSLQQLQAINGLRDAAQHHLVDISERHLHLQAQSGVTLYRDLLRTVFHEDLRAVLPDRVLPIATAAPLDPISSFTEEISEVAKLLGPKKWRGTGATAGPRALAIVDGAMQGERLQPSDSDLQKLGTRIAEAATDVDHLFPGISAVTFTTNEQGPTINLRIT